MSLSIIAMISSLLLFDFIPSIILFMSFDTIRFEIGIKSFPFAFSIELPKAFVTKFAIGAAKPTSSVIYSLEPCFPEPLK